MTAEIRIYIEGGGDTRHTRGTLRLGFDAFLKSVWVLPLPFDARYHLMVQSMEALFVADADALAMYYGQHFRRSALPTHTNLEAVTVTQLAGALKAATRGTTAGEYKKIQHAARILPRLNITRVRIALPHCERLFQFLESLL